MTVRQMFWNHAPLSMLRMAARATGGFRAKAALGLERRPWYAYGLLSAADHARKVGKSEIWALEFGVAAGRGMRNLLYLSRHVTRETGVTIRLAGFDTGSGMPLSNDYRDHPEKYSAGDFPMTDYAKLKEDLGDGVDLVIGDIAKTIDGFRERLSEDCPVGFVAIDVDTYTSSKATLRLFDGDANFYLPMTWCYFDDCSSRSHFNRFAGELLSIEEFNQGHELRKLDVDRGVWNAQRRLGPQLWHERMYILHIFDHPWRTAATKRSPKIIEAE